MNYQSYEDYMSHVLGYSLYNPNIYEPYNYKNYDYYENTYYRNDINIQMTEDEINKLYPEIYRLVYPIVCKVCDMNTQPITKDLIEKMTEEVYTAIQDTDAIVNVRIETKKLDNISTNSSRRSEIRTERTPKKSDENTVERENRQITRNLPFLRDLIKILILNQILGENKPQSPRPPRPPFSRGQEVTVIPQTRQNPPVVNTHIPNNMQRDYYKY